MTSQINYTSIDTTYPVAGQDNDSQGFRDNFSAISTALATAKTEITDLQTRAVVVADDQNDPVVNNLLGSTISNGTYTNFHGEVRVSGTSGSEIDITNGPLQTFTLSSSKTLTFINWPDSNQYAKVRVHFMSDTNGARTPTLATESGGTLVYSTGFPSLELNANGKHKVIEAWTYTGGSVVYVSYIGEF